MLKITVIAVGKLKEKFWTAACDYPADIVKNGGLPKRVWAW